ncbi:hypothetical protein [Pigmentiphaga litoralis]|uniref:Uncharacterized protein n=1 Tax=Pigmentiphaga litoralis TaxID=516702 RepID=A0A7Y9IXU9_9BURK|nr:hypothetical protein [Pigmentiphaga litoralis]NYE21942.1 hypothetical protein [Pigmentiphaga litoralis]NYE84443.1 hypothetical protein [Pigmentiphaga litoralis]
MNCKPGDLAVIVSSHPGSECNIGTFVTVVEPLGAENGRWAFERASRPLKMVDRSGRLAPSWVTSSFDDPPHICGLLDRFLRPIRGVSETIETPASLETV